MTKFTLEKILKKLIKRNFISNQSYFDLQIGDDIKNVCRGELNNKIELLAPVDYVFITYNNVRKNLIEIDNYNLSYPLTLEEIKKDLYKYYKVNVNDITEKAIIKVVCKKLPNIFLESFLYKEDIISCEIYNTLLKHHNTILNIEAYKYCIDYIKKNKKILIKQYSLIPLKQEFSNSKVNCNLNPVEMLEKILSIICEFNIKIRKSHDYAGTDFYIIEENNTKWIKSKE